MRESHARGLTWDQVGRIFRVGHTTAAKEAGLLDPGDLDAEIVQGVVEQMRAGPEAMGRLLAEGVNAR